MHADGGLSRNRPGSSVVVPAIVLVLLLGFAEHSLGVAAPMWTLHLAPVALAARYARPRDAAFVGATSVLVWGILLMPVAGTTASLTLGVVDLSMRIFVLGLCGMGISAWTRSLQHRGVLAHTDRATGVLSEQAFLDLLERELERARRYARPFSLSQISIDNLPAPTQRQDVDAAEEMIRAVAGAVASEVRTIDAVGRIRVAEFAILLPETGAAGLETVIARILDRCNTLDCAGAIGQPKLSIGAVTWLHSELSFSQLLQRTHQLLFSAQRSRDADFIHAVLDERVSTTDLQPT